MLVLALQFSRSHRAAISPGWCRGVLATRAPRRAHRVGGHGTCSGLRGHFCSLKTEEKTRTVESTSSWRRTYDNTTSFDRTDSAPTKPVRLGWNECPPTRRVGLLRKEVIQPHLPVRLPCYDFTPITDPTFDGSFLAVRPPASGVADFRGVTGGVYKARERIHPGVLIRDY